MYQAIAFFRDIQDDFHVYEVGDIYPRKGYTPSEARIKELISDNNKRGCPVIECVMNPPEEPAIADDEPVKQKARKEEKHMSMTELCAELKNWFYRDRYIGNITIKSGVISLNNKPVTLLDGQYFRIVGSTFDDGVHKHPATGLHDEAFDGAVSAMAVPPAVIELSQDIDDWIDKYGGVDSAAMSPFQSESFGGYSYSKGAVSRFGDGSGSVNPNTWQNVFADRLKLWRKAR